LSGYNFKYVFIFIAEHNPEEISNTPNISIQPFAQTDATGQGFNYDLNQEPTENQD